jgi:hypothetical protein
MPAQIEGLTAAELLSVIRHERETLSGEKFDIAKWEEAVTTLEADPNPKVAEKAKIQTIIEEWKALPAGA